MNNNKLYLDDLRKTPFGWDRVYNYSQFVEYIDIHGVPAVISFDHDLGREHYPSSEDELTAEIPYETYSEKTGYDCAKYIVENNLPLQRWSIHSMNPVGRDNIYKLLRSYEERNSLASGYVPSGNIR